MVFSRGCCDGPLTGCRRLVKPRYGVVLSVRAQEPL